MSDLYAVPNDLWEMLDRGAREVVGFQPGAGVNQILWGPGRNGGGGACGADLVMTEREDGPGMALLT